jgi:hypothetical protein
VEAVKPGLPDSQIRDQRSGRLVVHEPVDHRVQEAGLEADLGCGHGEGECCARVVGQERLRFGEQACCWGTRGRVGEEVGAQPEGFSYADSWLAAELDEEQGVERPEADRLDGGRSPSRAGCSNCGADWPCVDSSGASATGAADAVLRGALTVGRIGRV